MYRIAIAILFSARLVALVTSIGKAIIAVGGLLGVAAYSNDWLMSGAIDVLNSTPVFGLIMLILGQWMGEAFDILTYRIEGGVGGASARHVRWRMGFTRSLLNKPRWYPNEDRIVREFERTDRAMIAAGFAGLGKWHPDDAKSNNQTADYLRACATLINEFGIRKAGHLSAPLLRQIKSKSSASLYV